MPKDAASEAQSLLEYRLERLERAVVEVATVAFIHLGSTNIGPRPAITELYDEVNGWIEAEKKEERERLERITQGVNAEPVRRRGVRTVDWHGLGPPGFKR